MAVESLSDKALAEFEKFFGGELEEVPDTDSGDFAGQWDFHESKVLIGSFAGTKIIEGTKYGDRPMHSFSDASVGNDVKAMEKVGDIEVWGATVLDAVLKDIKEGEKVMVVYDGLRGRANIFRAYKAKDAF